MVVRVEMVVEIMGGDFEDGGGADRVVFLYFATGGICVVIDYLCPIVIVGYCGITIFKLFNYKFLCLAHNGNEIHSRR